jgi:hypothetical protein
MLSTLKRHFESAINRNTVYQNLMFGFCFLFGFAMIANTQQAGDGGWYWYAVLLHGGRRLYSDMHLALQPFFVLETSSFLALLGDGWLVSKIPAVLHALAYCIGLMLVVRQLELPDRQKALILGCSFFVAICFEGYRFDDYHVLADCFEIYSLVALLMLQKTASTGRSLGLVMGLGILSGLSLVTRLNDGAALIVGICIAIFCLRSRRRMLSILLFGFFVTVTVVLTVRLTGDSLHDYAMYSIFKAAGSKGGAGNVLVYPLQLPWNTLLFLKGRWYVEIILYCFVAAATWVYLLGPALLGRGPRRVTKATIAIVFITLPLYHVGRAFLDSDVIISLSAAGTLAAYIVGGLVFVRFLRWQFSRAQLADWDRREILLLIPLGQLASASMSSGGHHWGLYGPLGVMILLLPIASPVQIRTESVRSVMIAFATLLLCYCVVEKARVPYSWHSYQARPMFVGRQWYRHPEYGPMIIDTRQLDLMNQICTRIEASDSRELLSLPFPYANYFCSIPPWHDYVQTFFDLSGNDTIMGLMNELGRAPPRWILYQRQLQSLALHESIFNQGRPLPHRYLDQMIEKKLDSGDWRIVYTNAYGDRPGWSNEWILICTRP